jgi:iron-sulfur cluster repair protein YtfE (RIC family)
MNLLDQSVGWLARDIPGSAQVFREYQMDFCCGGQHALRGVGLAQLRDDLVQAHPSGKQHPVRGHAG